MRDSLVIYYASDTRPNGALFVAVGDFEPAKMMAQIEQRVRIGLAKVEQNPRPELPKIAGGE